MIVNETVLILGAGSSMSYSFPSGWGLVKLINDMLQDHSPTVELLGRHGYDLDLIEEFRNSLVLSGRSSVDEFLEYRTEFLKVGKEAITAALIKYELTKNLFDVNKEDNWYQYLFGLLNTSFDDFDQNKLSIITFNYDRSLEQYLFTALKHAYNKSDEKCLEKLEKIPILHVHGKLGRLPWEQSNYTIVPYDIINNPDKLGQYIGRGGENIKIIHENIENDAEFQQAFKLMMEARYIYFLGFGFNETNLKRLRIKSLCDPDVPDKIISGTSFGLSQKVKHNVENIRKTPNRLIELYPQRIYDFLYNNKNVNL